MTEKQKLFQELNDRMVKDLGIKDMEKERYYTWEISIYDKNEILIYEQEQENENSYICISHIIKQLLEENPQYKFHLM